MRFPRVLMVRVPPNYATFARWIVSAGAACGVLACSDSEPTESVDSCLPQPADAACGETLYGTDATFSDVVSRTLQPKCGSSGACHEGDAARGGFRLDSEAAAWDALNAVGARGVERLIPGDTECGEVIYRLELPSSDGLGMPPGAQLSEAERCSIRHWIARGAPR